MFGRSLGEIAEKLGKIWYFDVPDSIAFSLPFRGGLGGGSFPVCNVHSTYILSM